jgi:hypothetical protein
MKTRVPAGASSVSPPSVEGGSAGEHDVHLLVPERALRVLLDHVSARLPGYVCVDPDCTDVERSSDWTPKECPVQDRDRLDLVEMHALPAVGHGRKSSFGG